MKKRKRRRLEKAFYTCTILVLVFSSIAILSKSLALALIASPVYVMWAIMALAVMEK